VDRRNEIRHESSSNGWIPAEAAGRGTGIWGHEASRVQGLEVYESTSFEAIVRGFLVPRRKSVQENFV